MKSHTRRATALAAMLLLAGGRISAQQGHDPFAGHTYQPGIDVLEEGGEIRISKK